MDVQAMEYNDYTSIEDWLEHRWRVWRGTQYWAFDEMVCRALIDHFGE